MRKISLLLLAAAALVPAFSAQAQLQTRSVQMTVGDFTGTMTYSYRLADGKEVLEGKKSFSASSGEDTYSLEANFKGGKLDGSVSARLHRGYTASGYDAGALHVWKAAADVTLSGRFREGQLTGLLTCNYVPSGSEKAGLSDMHKQSFSANYANGHVSGSYSYLSYGMPQKVVVNGTTDSDGWPDGKWQIWFPEVGELMTLTYQHGAEMTDLTSSVRNCLSGKISERQLFDDYGYLPQEETLSFQTAADYFDNILRVWLRDYRKVIPYDFSRSLHQVKVIRYVLPASFTSDGFEKFKTLYFESLCGGKPLQNISLKAEGNTAYAEVFTRGYGDWNSNTRNVNWSVSSGEPIRIWLASYQIEELADEQAIDAVRRRFARSGEVLLEGESPYKELLTSQQMPSDLISSIHGAERIAAKCMEIKSYLTSVRATLASLEKTPDGKFFIKDGVYYQNPGWDLNLMIADADRIITSCKEAGRLYDTGSEYLASWQYMKESYASYCGKIQKGTYPEVIGAIEDARYFADKVVTPDVLGKIGTRDEMRQNLTDKSFSHLMSVYPTDPYVSLRDHASVDQFVAKSLEYAGFQRCLLEFDTLVKEIRADKAQLDTELAADRAYKQMIVSVNQKLTGYNLHPSFKDVKGYEPVKASLEECAAVVRDARDYLAVHQQLQIESGRLRDTFSKSKTGTISKFYRNITKNLNQQWDPNLPVGRCSSNVREALGITRRISAVVAEPDAAARDKAIKGLTDPAEIWNILEAK